MSKICVTSKKFETQKILKEHIRKRCGGKMDFIKSGESSRYLSKFKDKVQTQGFKRVGGTICEETFTCQQNLKENKNLEHGIIALFKCNVCPKMF